MEAKRSNFAIKLLPSLTDVAFLMPIVFLFGKMDGVKTLLSDCDTGWHIRTGEWILAHHQVPLHDIFSYSKPDGVWYAWEWLTDILFASLYGHGGLRTVVFFAMMLISLTFALLFRLVRRKSNAITAVVVTMIAAAASSIHWLARPHLFTLLFLVLFYGALENVRSGKTRLGRIPYLVLLPIASILWTNLHGGFFVGAVLIAAYAAGDLLKIALTTDVEARGPAMIRARHYTLCSMACVAASLVNPYTWRLHQHVIEYLRDPYQSQHIMEFLSLSFHHPVAIFFEIMLLGGVAAALWNASKGRYTEAVLIVVFGHTALLAARNIPLFMIVAAPVIAAAVDEWVAVMPNWNVAGWVRKAAEKFAQVAEETTATDRMGRWYVPSILAALVFGAVIYAPNPPKSARAEFDPESYPAGAVNLLRHDPDARIFAHDQWGDYLIYRLYPHTKVFMDGRSDFYGPDFEKKYQAVLNVSYDWEKTLSRFHVDTVLLPPSAPLAGALKESAHWRVIYDDHVALVFRSTQKTTGETVSAAGLGDGESRDREVTKTQARDQAITEHKSKT
jgi:hypothetical protein